MGAQSQRDGDAGRRPMTPLFDNGAYQPGPRSSTPGAIAPRTVAVLGGVAAVVPAAIDLYLAALPDVAGDLGVSSSVAQLTMTLFVLVLGAGQLVAGPLTDTWGRRRPLIVGLLVLAAGAGAASLAPNATALIVARLVQAAGGALAYVAALSAVRDLESGAGAARTFAMMTTASAAAPILAPIAGGFIAEWVGWRGVFVSLALLATVLAGAAVAWLPETRSAAARTTIHLRTVGRSYLALLGNPNFVTILAAFAAVSVALFTYIAGSPFVFQESYNLDASTYGILYGASSLAVILGARSVPWAVRRIGVATVCNLGMAIMVLGAVALTLLTAAGLPVVVLGVTVAVMVFGVGVSEPPTMTRAMDQSQHDHGSAAAVVGAVMYGGGALSSAVMAVTGVRDPVVWASTIAVTAGIGLCLALAATRMERRSS